MVLSLGKARGSLSPFDTEEIAFQVTHKKKIPPKLVRMHFPL
jgi:hypothetical protein